MKKFLLASIAFFLFAISVSILQTSCDKEADASPEASNQIKQLNKLFYTRFPNDFSPAEIWTANYDGTGQAKLNISMPGGYVVSTSGGPCVSPDGKKLFFTGANTTTWKEYIFSSNLDGSNVNLILEMGGGVFDPEFGGAY